MPSAPCPLLSVVVVLHGEQGFVRGCLGSVLDQAGDLAPVTGDGPGTAPVADAVEVVVVDDASPDRAPAVADEVAAADPRVRVVRLPDPVDLGTGRAHGVAHASGAYVWCLEPTDTLRPGALSAVADRLRVLAPDVLLVGHERVDTTGRTRPGPDGRLLRRTPAGETVDLDGRPGLARLSGHAAAAVVRRARVAAPGPPVSGASDVAWVAPVLLAADRVAVLARDCVRCHEVDRRPPRAVAGGPADVVAAYDAVLSWAASQGGPVAGRRGALVEAMARHLLALVAAVPEADRPALTEAAGVCLRRHVRAGDPLPPGRLVRARLGALRRGRPRALAALDRAGAVARGLGRRRAAVTRGRRRQAQRWRRRRLQRVYRRARREPLDPDLAVFAAYWYRGYACNPAAVYEHARATVPGFRGVWVVERDAVRTLPDGVPYVLPGTVDYYRTLARATYLVNNVNFPNDVVKRPGQVHVQTHHGTPVKTMGLDLRDAPFSAARLDFRRLVRRAARWDVSLSSNPHSTEVWARVYPTAFETLESGYPRNDVLATATPDDVRRCREALGLGDARRVVLYAPTHREYRDGFVPLLDLARLADTLGDDAVLLVRGHYYEDAGPHLADLEARGRVRDVSAYPRVEDLCLAADVLVTDYSSLMVDYAVLDRPVVLYTPDLDVYATLRGLYLDLETEGPGVLARTEDALHTLLREGRERGEEATRARAAFRTRFCPWDDGHAAERVVRHVWARAAVPGKGDR